jgi:hypothetical protein
MPAPPTSFTSVLLLPVVVSIITIFSILARVAGGLAWLDEPINDPLSPFSALIPGQHESTLPLNDFECSADSDGLELCSTSLIQGPVAQIRMTLKDDIIYHVGFRLRENALRTGDMILLWGEPDLQERGWSVYLDWRHLDIRATMTSQSGEGRNYFSRVRWIWLGENRIARLRAL